ncbi:MAG TPA: hypothetical protein VJ417_12735 [Candidatus Glassbacteria bacterium]|nr:hypothetical protein [Candidatus Glassbacteria bacterium]
MEGAGSRITDMDRRLAAFCLACPVCSYARRKQRGLVYWFVKTVEGRVCPNGRAFEKVYGRKTYELPPDGKTDSGTGSPS